MAVDGTDLCAVAQSERLGEGCPTVGIDGGVGSGAADGDIGGAGIDDVGAERLQMGDHALGRGALGAVDGADPTVPDMAVGEMRQIEPLAGAVALLDPESGALGVDCDDGGDLAVQAVRAVVVAGELELVAGTELRLALGECLGLSAPQRAGCQMIALSWGPISRTAPVSASTCCTR